MGTLRYVPLDNFVNFIRFAWVLGRDVSFEVVAPRPRLIALFTSFHSAKVAFPTEFAMNRTFVSLQIV